MADIDAIFSREDMTFDEAVRYFKERVPITPARFYALAEEYRSLALTVQRHRKPLGGNHVSQTGLSAGNTRPSMARWLGLVRASFTRSEERRVGKEC